MEWRERKLFWCAILVVLRCGFAAMADPQGLALIKEAYESAKARYQAHPGDAEAAWQFARACFDRADNAGKDAEKAFAAKEGIAACEQALRAQPNSAAAYYYLGMNQGQLAQTKVFGALTLVKEMDKAWKKARELDESVDFAGPDRNLALLYRDAPRPPLSIGNRAKAEECALRAIALAPSYPENRLNLVETYLKWSRWAAAAEADDKLKDILPDARRQLSGPRWHNDWEDWDRRQAAVEKKIRAWRDSAERGK